jgi:DNA-binding HxlR family transcriptional regulator
MSLTWLVWDNLINPLFLNFGMGDRTGLEIKREILRLLKPKECVLSQLERKINTSGQVLKQHLEELEFLGIVRLSKHGESPKTGRPYTTAALNASFQRMR